MIIEVPICTLAGTYSSCSAARFTSVQSGNARFPPHSVKIAAILLATRVTNDRDAMPFMSTLIKSPDGKQKAIMSNDNERFSELAEWLQRQGHSLPEIDKILKKVQEYDQRVNLD